MQIFPYQLVYCENQDFRSFQGALSHPSQKPEYIIIHNTEWIIMRMNPRVNSDNIPVEMVETFVGSPNTDKSEIS